MQSAAADAQQQLYDRLLKPLKRMAERLLEQNKRVGEKDMVSMLEDLNDAVTMAPAFNVMDDPALPKLIEDIKGKMTNYRVSGLLESRSQRREAQVRADELVKKLSAYMKK